MDLPCGFHKLTCFSLRRRTVLHTGENEIVVRDRVPVPLLGDLRDSLCDDSEDVHPFKRHPCSHELWLALDFDGCGNGDGVPQAHLCLCGADAALSARGRVSWLDEEAPLTYDPSRFRPSERALLTIR